MTQCAYCDMAAAEVDPEFAPEAPSLDGPATCSKCDLPALAEQAMVRVERSLAWKRRFDRDDFDGERDRARSIGQTLEAAWRAA